MISLLLLKQMKERETESILTIQFHIVMFAYIKKLYRVRWLFAMTPLSLGVTQSEAASKIVIRQVLWTILDLTINIIFERNLIFWNNHTKNRFTYLCDDVTLRALFQGFR